MKRFISGLVSAIALLAGGASAQQAPAPVASPRIVMLRLYTTDFARSEKFYGAVFGVKVVQNMGDFAHILMFPGASGPGIILIKDGIKERRTGSFVIQAPDLAATLEAASANGGVLPKQRFDAPQHGVPAQSDKIIDPDGNLIEVLQIGKPH